MTDRMFAIGDIHGCFDTLRTLVEQKIRIKKNDQIIFLGDYIDRGPHSKEVIDYILDLQSNGFNIRALIGNHEAMLLNALDRTERLWAWLQNGAEETLKSFGIRSLKDLGPKYITFFRNLNYYFAIDQFLFVHAGFNDKATNPFDDKYSMVWTRNEHYEHPSLKDKIIVHGHTPIPVEKCRERLQMNRKVINIDTGCVYAEYPGYGKLTALEINSMTLYS
ncbi:MAG: metallophosphoesterase family protein, partial [Bacteroidota bacterium]|nr:metallophosphoesterase family protein [Bacteroidota bacterium]